MNFLPVERMVLYFMLILGRTKHTSKFLLHFIIQGIINVQGTIHVYVD